MEKQLEKAIICVLVLVCVPCLGSETNQLKISEDTEHYCLKNTKHNSLDNTELNISTVQLFYRIEPTGEYLCHFKLEAFGNSLTVVGPAQCVITISDPYIEQFNLRIFDNIAEVDATVDANHTLVTFSTTNHLIPVGYPFNIEGSYWGTYRTRESSTYNYTLGIDWGTTVGSQQTIIQFGQYQYTPIIVQPDPHFIEDKHSGISEFHWNEMFVQGFNAILKMNRRNSPKTFFIVDFPNWNSTIGQTVHVPLHNNGTFELNIYVITPNWITTNASNFILLPSQKIVLAFTITSIATLGINDTIQIVVWELREPIMIPVTVVGIAPQTVVFPFLLVVSIFTGVAVVSLSYYKRNAITKLMNSWKKGEQIANGPPSQKEIPELSSNPTWESIQSRWASILPEQEMQVLKILLDQGVVNQKIVAEELGVSAMTMSRIISRLEMKQLLFRERLGMSNMIKLNKRKL
ncbi:MAG: helix-turn-helix transcriptional regulator [Candidatus Hodarchaeales archaeon]|jgi:hypothetical protein